MKVLIVGGGGREHALAWKIAQSPQVGELYCAPGNGGIASLARCIPIEAGNTKEIVNYAKSNKVDLVVVAPDDPLAAGMVDMLEQAGIRAFGPDRKAAFIESSKVFSKYLMKKYGIPTAEHEVFDKADRAVEYLKNSKYPIVIKADGLALGKGVIIARDFDEAQKAVNSIMADKIFGSAGDKIIVEEYLTGPEISILSFTDGKTIVPMVSSQDHKRALDGDQGSNTGGMGAFSPSLYYTDRLHAECMDKIYIPTMEAMNQEGRKFKGVLYFGLILTSEGTKVLEYNARFGDPESQVVLPRLKTDIIDIFDAIIDEKLDSVKIEWENNAAVCLVLASGGYPEKYRTGFEIKGIDEAQKDKNVVVFHAGTRLDSGRYYTAGGRVLGVTALADTVEMAGEKAYKAAGSIDFPHMHYRRDIGKKAEAQK